MNHLVVELAGPAGAGKTSLVRALVEQDSSATAVGVRVRRSRLATALLTSAPELLTSRLTAPGRWWTRDELRALAYLSAWRGAVAADTGRRLLLLDHGPVFRLARLRGFGPPMSSTQAFLAHWERLAEDWGRVLDVVVWLDAPDEVLRARIGRRAQQHRMSGASDTETADFLARYRAAYRTALDAVSGTGARLVELDSSASRPADLASTLRALVLPPLADTRKQP